MPTDESKSTSLSIVEGLARPTEITARFRNGSILLDRLLRRMEVCPSGCWLWTGSCNNKGYGTIRFEGVTYTVHKIAWELLVGELPLEIRLDHVECLIKNCFNPDHLEPVDDKTNNRRNQGWTETTSGVWLCQNLHPVEGHNAMRYYKNRVQCRTCHNDRRRAAHNRKSTRH